MICGQIKGASGHIYTQYIYIHLWRGKYTYLRIGKYIYTISRSKLSVAITWCKGDHLDKVTGTIDSVFVKIDQKNNVKRMP